MKKPQKKKSFTIVHSLYNAIFLHIKSLYTKCGWILKYCKRLPNQKLALLQIPATYASHRMQMLRHVSHTLQYSIHSQCSLPRIGISLHIVVIPQHMHSRRITIVAGGLWMRKTNPIIKLLLLLFKYSTQYYYLKSMALGLTVNGVIFAFCNHIVVNWTCCAV